MNNISTNISFNFNEQTPNAFYQRADQLIANKQTNEAVALLQIGEKFYHSKARTYFLLSKAHKDINEKKELFYLEKCLKEQSTFKDALLRIVDFQPKRYRELLHFAHMQRVRGNHQLAQQLSNKALQVQLDNKIINHTFVLHHYIRQKKIKNYLELGVYVGFNLFQLNVPKTIAVDAPLYIPNWQHNTNPKIIYHNTPLIDFTKNTTLLKQQNIELCLINHVHQFSTSLPMVLNLLDSMTADGVILLTNCKPDSKAAAQSTHQQARRTEGYQEKWVGDNYKTIATLKATRADIKVFVLDCENGLGIIQKQKTQKLIDANPEKIAQLTYEELSEDTAHWISLKAENLYASLWREI